MSYTIHYVERVRSTDKPYYYSAPYWSSSRLSQNIIASIRKSEQSFSVQKQTTMGNLHQHLNNLQATFGASLGLDDIETREKVWRMFFKDKPLPQVKANAIREYYGALDKYVDWNKIDLKKSKRKIEKFLDE